MSADNEATCAGKTEPPEWSLSFVTGDLFSCPVGEALANCISEDCRMGAGIALTFRQQFEGVPELKEQKKRSGECAVLRRDGRFLYYLVEMPITKKKYNHKPTYDSLRRSLEDMRRHCEENGVSRISMPRIGCGLDRLEWSKVSECLERVFRHSGVSITVYSLPQKTQSGGKTLADD